MQALFPPLPFKVCAAMKALPSAINAALPLKTAHKRDLPLAVEELSLRLTSERSTLTRPYWSMPRLTSAYVRYFLPWNIIRLARLFAGLPLPSPTPVSAEKFGAGETAPYAADSEEAKPSPNVPSDALPAGMLPRLLVDVGSGPLTVPIALWMAKPEWRDLPLTVLCLDAAPQPLDIGKKIFLHLAGEHSPWRIVTRRASLDGLARELRTARGVPWLLTAANVINEIPLKTGQYNDERFASIAEVAAHFCQRDDASALFVEPGTRLGGKNMVSLREQALEAGLYPVAPCPHAAPCPVQESRSWCHFTFDTGGTPPWLLELSRQSNLTKDGLSLAFMLLQNSRAAQSTVPMSTQAGTPDTANTATIEQVRVISAPFVIPGMWGSARYACSARGLALLTEAQSFQSGSLVEALWPADARQDKKSGAFIITPHKAKGEVIAHSAPRKGQRPVGASPARGDINDRAGTDSGDRPESGGRNDNRSDGRSEGRRTDRPKPNGRPEKPAYADKPADRRSENAGPSPQGKGPHGPRDSRAPHTAGKGRASHATGPSRHKGRGSSR